MQLGDLKFCRCDDSDGVVFHGQMVCYHGLPDDLLSIVLTSECVSLTKRRRLCKRFARLYRPLIYCRHPECQTKMMSAFVKTFAMFGIVTDATVICARRDETSYTRYATQIQTRRTAWRAQNAVFSGEMKILLSGKPHAILSFMLETLERYAEPTDAEFWEEFQSSRHLEDNAIAANRLQQARRKRFEELEYLIIALQEIYPVEANRAFDNESTKVKCDRFMARVFCRIICHYFVEQPKWGGYLHLRSVADVVGRIVDNSDASQRVVFPAIATHLTAQRHLKANINIEKIVAKNDKLAYGRKAPG